jgi:hypothetical protein
MFYSFYPPSPEEGEALSSNRPVFFPFSGLSLPWTFAQSVFQGLQVLLLLFNLAEGSPLSLSHTHRERERERDPSAISSSFSLTIPAAKTTTTNLTTIPNPPRNPPGKLPDLPPSMPPKKLTHRPPLRPRPVPDPPLLQPTRQPEPIPHQQHRPVVPLSQQAAKFRPHARRERDEFREEVVPFVLIRRRCRSSRSSSSSTIW